jgi:membrane-bound serine protease (ClpP class)
MLRLAPLLLILAVSVSLPGAEGGLAITLKVEGAIGPATSDYLHRALQQAQEQGADLVVLMTDTPGGLDTAMRDIIRDIIASPIPIVVYVAPSGARAASAGTYILYASHIAAMAPGTNLGAATPIAIGGLPGIEPPAPESPSDADGSDEADEEEGAAADRKTSAAKEEVPKNKLEAKMVNDAVAYIRSLAQLRGRNADWAERAVREAASLSSEEALAAGVIEHVAEDLSDLLAQLDGRRVEVLGEERALATRAMSIETIEPDWRSRLLSVITNPNIAYVLMLLGIYGLIFELANPGYVLPGVVGGICLVLALYAFQVLPVNYAGVALIALGIAFMVSELFVPSFGALGIGGAVAFIIGSIILYETGETGFTVSRSIIAGVGLASVLTLIALIAMARRIHLRAVVTGREEMLGLDGVVVEDFQGRGRIRIHGEIWQANCEQALKRDQRVRVTDLQGLILKVQPVTEEK